MKSTDPDLLCPRQNFFEQKLLTLNKKFNENVALDFNHKPTVICETNRISRKFEYLTITSCLLLFQEWI